MQQGKRFNLYSDKVSTSVFFFTVFHINHLGISAQGYFHHVWCEDLSFLCSTTSLRRFAMHRIMWCQLKNRIFNVSSVFTAFSLFTTAFRMVYNFAWKKNSKFNRPYLLRVECIRAHIICGTICRIFTICRVSFEFLVNDHREFNLIWL